jgi:hypothetical protein
LASPTLSLVELTKVGNTTSVKYIMYLRSLGISLP